PVSIVLVRLLPRFPNASFGGSFLLRRRGRPPLPYVGVVTVPRKLPRLVLVPGSGKTIDYIFLHDLIASHARNLYRGYEVLSVGAFRVTRNSNLYLHKEESRDLL